MRNIQKYFHIHRYIFNEVNSGTDRLFIKSEKRTKEIAHGNYFSKEVKCKVKY